MSSQILQGDALHVLKTLPDSSVQCVITSPPYYALRSYLPDGHPNKHLEIGLEDTPAAYIARLVEVFHEVKRVLRPDGTCWINMGDTSSNDEKWGGHPSGKHRRELHVQKRPKRYTGLPGKNLLMIPERLALGLQADGWILRSKIVWYKPTALPEPFDDRPSRSYEMIYLLTRRPKYYYDSDSIREPLKPKTLTTYGTRHHGQGNDALGLVKSDNWGRSIAVRKPRLTAEGTLAGANKRDVWTIKAQPYEYAHFATFPPKLVEPMLLAGSLPQACEHCGSPWKRVVFKVPRPRHIREEARAYNNSPTKADSTGWEPNRLITNRWEPSCRCEDNQGTARCSVLDPFCGSGTVPYVSIQYGRDYLGIELNPAYIELIQQRIAEVQVTLWPGIA